MSASESKRMVAGVGRYFEKEIYRLEKRIEALEKKMKRMKQHKSKVTKIIEAHE